MRRPLLFAAVAHLAAATLSAQQLSLRLGGLAAQYADSIDDQAGSLSMRLTAQSQRASAIVDASWAEFGGGGAAGQAWARALLVGASNRSTVLGLRGDALANTVRNGPWSATAALEGFGSLFTGPWTFSVSASAGSVRYLDGTSSGQAGAMGELLGQFGPWTLAAAVNATGADTLRFADYSFTAAWRSNRVEIGGFAAARSGDLSTGAWGQAYAALALSPAVAIETTLGSYPKDITGFDQGRFANLGLRVYLHGGTRTTGAVAGTAERPVEPDVTVLRIDSASIQVTFVVAGATTASIAGAWNEWDPAPLMRADATHWVGILALPRGTHRFSLVLDEGRWHVPAAVTRLPDDFGGEVGLLVVP